MSSHSRELPTKDLQDWIVSLKMIVEEEQVQDNTIPTFDIRKLELLGTL
jgi:hypothetical protein